MSELVFSSAKHYVHEHNHENVIILSIEKFTDYDRDNSTYLFIVTNTVLVIFRDNIEFIIKLILLLGLLHSGPMLPLIIATFN